MAKFRIEDMFVPHHHYPDHDRPLDLVIREPVKIVQIEFEIRDVVGKVLHRTGQQRTQADSVFRPFFSAMADQQWYHNGQFDRFSLVLFDIETPDLFR